MTEHRKAGSAGRGERVEVGRLPGGDVFVRAGLDPQGGPVLTFTQEEWAAFVAGVKNGEFDLDRAWAATGAMSPDR